MAKPLKKAPPKSSMSRFWDKEYAEQALSPQPTPAPEARPLRVVESTKAEKVEVPTPATVKVTSPVRAPRVQVVAKERLATLDLNLTPHAQQILNELVASGKQSINRALSATQLVRGILLALEDNMPEIQSALDSMGPQKQPSTESRFAAAREEFEKTLGALIVKAVRG